MGAQPIHTTTTAFSAITAVAAYVRDRLSDDDGAMREIEPPPTRTKPRNPVRNYVRYGSLANAAIAIVRCKGRFRYVPEANRHYAARIQDALDTILTPPTA